MAIGASFWSFAAIGPYLAAIPYTTNSEVSGPYLWSNQGQNNAFTLPSGAPGCRVGATAAQFLMMGDLYQYQVTPLFTSNGSQTTFSGSILAPMGSAGTIYDAEGHVSGTFNEGAITAGGYLSSGTVNYTSGALSLTFSTAPPAGDIVYAGYTQVAPYRVWWSAIGDPTTWPTPLTQAAIAAQSGYQDLAPDFGQVMFIAGYPLYALIFQRFGITRATYIGGAPVFSFAQYEFTHGLVSHGAAIQVGPIVYFLADDGFWETDGANVAPIGTGAKNEQGIDNWLWENLNLQAVEAIRAGYDAEKRCVFFAIPTGSNTLPDTLLIFNPLAGKWTRALIASETIWTYDNGEDSDPPTRQTLGLIDQAHTPNQLSGAPLTGYLEHCDLYFIDGARRLTTGVRPIVNSTDQPLVTVGVRQALQDPLIYGAPQTPDTFSRIAPALSSGIYTRSRVQSSTAQSLKGATLYLEQEGPI